MRVKIEKMEAFAYVKNSPSIRLRIDKVQGVTNKIQKR